MWVIAEYEATALFSLKAAHATSSGGQTLLVPTPFAIKMALLDIVCRVEGLPIAKSVFEWLNTVQIAIQLPHHIVINNTFIRILSPRRETAAEGSAHIGHFGQTVAYREFAYYGNRFSIAVEVQQFEYASLLQHWLIQLNYLGKRGGFVQIQSIPRIMDDLESGFISLTGNIGNPFRIDAIMTQLDNTSSDLTFEKANVYTKQPIILGKERLLQLVVLPYQLVGSSRSYSFYELAP